MESLRLACELEDSLAGSPLACVSKGSETLFDLRAARYSISGENGQCIMHLWSQERNAVRRVFDIEHK